MFRQVLRNNFRAKYKALKTKTQNITEPRRIDSSRLFMYRCFYIVRILCDEKSSAAEISFFELQRGDVFHTLKSPDKAARVIVSDKFRNLFYRGVVFN